VVRSDGSIGGFAFGTARKRALLRREGVAVVAGKVPLGRHRARHLLSHA
jgi:alkylated DNA nucleotide flippase Atl1